MAGMCRLRLRALVVRSLVRNERGLGMLADSLLALTALAGRMVVTAVDTDAWETARRGFAEVLGRGDATQTRLAEQRLDETRRQLAGVATTSARRSRAALADRWAVRFEDLLEETPGAETDL